jgi:hypothetical protein
MVYFECETEYCAVTVIEVRLSSWHLIGVELVYFNEIRYKGERLKVQMF